MTAPVPPLDPNAALSVHPSFRTLAIASSGLSAQRARMDVIATNVANAETTRSADGGPYRRRVVELQATAASEFKTALSSANDLSTTVAKVAAVANPLGSAAETEPTGVTVKSIVEDQTPGQRVYEPGHPDADKDGYVTYPNVRVTDELVDLMDARQMYEALTSVFMVTKSIMHSSIEI